MATHVDILNAVRNIAEGVPSLVGASTVIRKRPFFLTEHDSFPLLCLSPLPESVESETFENTAFIDYPVVVMFVQSRNSGMEETAQTLLQCEVREELRLALWKPSLPGVDPVMDCLYDPDAPFDMSALDDAFDVSLQLFTFRTNQARADS